MECPTRGQLSLSKEKSRPFPEPPAEVAVTSLTPEGWGLAQVADKPLFLHGALPEERVRFRYTRIRKDYAEGVVEEVLQASPERAQPRCPFVTICGGCCLQHWDPGARLRWQQALLAQALEAAGQVRPERWLPPLATIPWGYRRKARLGVRYVAKKGRTLVGFRERGTSYVAELRRCEILHPMVGERLGTIADLLDGLSIRKQIPQIELAMGEGPCVLVLRVLAPPTEEDVVRLTKFGSAHGLHFYLQTGGTDTIRPLPGQDAELFYCLPEADIRLDFQPTDFTQVNLGLNRLLVDQALALLDPGPDERVLDLFCGLGNFTLPIARRAGSVVGVEGDAGLVDQARANAARNGIANVSFVTADLYGAPKRLPEITGRFHKVLLDPPRSGALPVLERLPTLGIRRILYVSCSPATLARDAERLVNGLGYRPVAAGVLDMFPHTTHVESMMEFERDRRPAEGLWDGDGDRT